MRNNFDENQMERSAGLRSFTDPFSSTVQRVESQSPIGKFAAMNMEAHEPGSFTSMQPPTPPSAIASFLPFVGPAMNKKYESDITKYAMSLPHDDALQYLAQTKPDKFLPMFLNNADPMRQMQMEAMQETRQGARATQNIFQRALAGSSYDSTLKGIEGTGDNPNSTASGDYQFLDGTWIDTVRKNAPQMANFSDADILALKKQNGPFKDQMYQAFTQGNRQQLASTLGREPTDGELYLAHQQGAGGAIKLLSNPDARAVDVVGRAAVLNNGGDENMTAGQFANKWTSRFAGTQPQGQKPAMTSVQRMALELAAANPSQYGAAGLAAMAPQEAKPRATAGLPTGQMWDETGTKAVPIPGVQQPKGDFKEYQIKPAGFAARMIDAEKRIGEIGSGAAVNELASGVASVPLVGEYAAQSLLRTDDQQKYKNAADEWIRSKLRLESGAAIGVDEMKQEYRTYFPQPGDSQAVIEQKAGLRKKATDVIIKSSNGAYEALYGETKKLSPIESLRMQELLKKQQEGQ
jgi:hypothetical protein